MARALRTALRLTTLTVRLRTWQRPVFAGSVGGVQVEALSQVVPSPRCAYAILVMSMDVLARSNVLLQNKAFRDKVLKAVQYLCKVCVELPAFPLTDALPSLKTLASHISSARRLYRFVLTNRPLLALAFPVLPRSPSLIHGS